MKPKIKFILKQCLPILILAVAGLATTAQAFTFQTPWPPSPMGTDIKANPTIAYGIKYIYEWGIGLGGVAVFIVLVMAGFQYITSVGDPTKMKEAFKRIEDAVVGLLILLSSWAILNFVGLNLNSINIKMFEPKPVDPIKHCKGEKGQPAPVCCETTDKDGNTIKIANCQEALWTCVGSSATATEEDGICQPNTESETCTMVKVYYGTTSQTIDSFNTPQELSSTQRVTKLERWYHEGGILGVGGTDKLCYDPTNPEAKDPSVNKACECSVQLLTEKSGAQTTGTSTDVCSNTSGGIS